MGHYFKVNKIFRKNIFLIYMLLTSTKKRQNSYYTNSLMRRKIINKKFHSMQNFLNLMSKVKFVILSFLKNIFGLRTFFTWHSSISAMPFTTGHLYLSSAVLWTNLILNPSDDLDKTLATRSFLACFFLTGKYLCINFYFMLIPIKIFNWTFSWDLSNTSSVLLSLICFLRFVIEKIFAKLQLPVFCFHPWLLLLVQFYFFFSDVEVSILVSIFFLPFFKIFSFRATALENDFTSSGCG